MARLFKTGGHSFCWHCDKQLMRKKDDFYYSIVVDPIGNEHKVHKDCVKHVIGDGIKEKKGDK